MGIRRASTLQPWQQELGKTIANLFGGLGETASGFLNLMPESAQEITSDWTENFATPVMDMWRRSIQPFLEEGANAAGVEGMPGGGFYSRGRFDTVQREAEEFLSGRVMPTLFGAQEARRARVPQYGGIYANLLATAAGLSTTPTMQSFNNPKSWIDDTSKELDMYSNLGGDIGAIFTSLF